MQKEMDTIQFESREEIEELMGAVTKYIEQNPSEKENETIKRFYDLLDVMDMEW